MLPNHVAAGHLLQSRQSSAMTFCSLLVLLAVSFTATVALSLPMETSLRLIDAVDICFNDLLVPVETTLCSSASDVLGDVRNRDFDSSYQCRSLC